MPIARHRLHCFLLLAALAISLSAGEATGVVIAAFSSPDDLLKGCDWDPAGVDASIGPRAVTERDQVLKLVAKAGEYPGISLRAPRLPKDWSGYEVLTFTVWSTADRDLAVNVKDEKSVSYASRFNGGAPLLKGRNRVQIPIATIAKSIDVHRVTSLTLFLDHPPAGFTLWIANLGLGKAETDAVPFIPYAERYDHQPSMEVVSPHLPLGRNLAGGPLSAFLLAGVKQGREVVEMMERVDLAPKVLSWDREWGINTWLR